MDPQKMFSGSATCEDVMQCFFNLNELEIELYLGLVNEGQQRSDALAKKVKKDGTTVYRALQKLTSCGICFRETKTIDRGGYYHVYSAVSLEVLKKKIQDCIKRWNTNMKKALEEFDERFLKED
jgi:predicted transcriptional regulator